MASKHRRMNDSKHSTPIARVVSALTQTARTTQWRLAADITGPLAQTPCFEPERFQYRGGKTFFLFRMRNAWTEVTGGA